MPRAITVLKFRVSFLLSKIKEFEKIVEVFNKKIAELGDSGELFKDLTPKEITDMYCKTLKYYSDVVDLARVVSLQLVMQEEDRRKEGTAFIVKRKNIQKSYKGTLQRKKELAREKKKNKA